MSELVAEMDRAAAAYWKKVARAGGAEAASALAKAQQFVVEARAESRVRKEAHQPTLNEIEAPPIRYKP